MEEQLYLEGTTQYIQLASKVREQCCDWKRFVPDTTGNPAAKQDIYECDVSTEDRRALIVQLIKDEGRKIAKWAPGLDKTKSMIEGPFWLKRGHVWHGGARMLVLPLVASSEAGDEQAQEAKIMLREMKRNDSGQLEWGQGQHPVRWQARSPLQVLGNTALVLQEGDIMFVVVKVVTKPETAGESQGEKHK